ncbi:hypothetical protein C8K30_108115 [Promicromonospora sp. AC04]|nr:hypothetical protein C8K30_108115 [Promicromonospora sp. AC04]
MRRAAWLVTAGLVVGLVTACSTPPPSGAVPARPAGVEAPDEYAFGDDVAARDLRAWGPVYDALVEEVDEERLRNLPLVLDADVDVAEVRDAYQSELVGVRGWDAMPEQPTVDDAWAQGWTSPDGQDALVLVGLEPRSGETHVPLTVLTTLPDEGAA